MYVIAVYCLSGVLLLWEETTGHSLREKKEWIIYCAIALFFLLRFPQGNDIGPYYDVYEMATGSITESLHYHMTRNLLFTGLAYLCKVLFHDFRWFILVCNLIVLAVLTYTISGHGKHYLAGMLLFVGSGLLEVYYSSGLRQSLCSSLFLFAYYVFLPRKKYLAYEIFCILGLGFHEAAIFAMIVPLLEKLVPYFRKNTKKFLITAIAVTVGLLVFNTILLEPFAWWLTSITGYAPSWTHVIAYLRFREFSILGIGMEGVFLIGILLLHHMADKERYDDFTWFEVLTFIMSVLFYFALSCYSNMSRITDFLQVIQVILIPELISMIPLKKRRILSLTAVFLLNLFLLYSDLRVKTAGLSRNLNQEINVMNYGYCSIFDTDQISTYLEAVK